MARPKNLIPTVPWRVHIPQDIANTVEVLLADPLTGGRKQGARNTLVTRLLREWVEGQKNPGEFGPIPYSSTFPETESP